MTKLLVLIVLLLWEAPAIYAQQAEDLRQQLEQLKQEYQRKIEDLEQGLAFLENQTEQKKETRGRPKEGTVSAVELAAEEAAHKAVAGESDQVGAKFQGQLPSEPTYDFPSEADRKIAKLQEQLSSSELHEYFRSGYGLNSVGGRQVAFEAPGAGAKYRVGNEAETYGEFIFVNNWLNPDHNSDKAWMKTEVMIEANTTNSASYANFAGGTSNDQFRLREAFVQAGNVLESQPDAKFWAGERYYRRQHIDIDDFYPVNRKNMSMQSSVTFRENSPISSFCICFGLFDYWALGIRPRCREPSVAAAAGRIQEEAQADFQDPKVLAEEDPLLPASPAD
jgi:maltoporin